MAQTDWAYKKFDNDPYIQGAAPYIDKAIDWARQTGLKVWIDLHGAPLSQNGYGTPLIQQPLATSGNMLIRASRQFGASHPKARDPGMDQRRLG